MTTPRIYRFTSIGRPLDAGFATNRAVLRLLPVAALLGAVARGLRGGFDGSVVTAAVVVALAAFGGWALARELAPDHDPPAFVAMALAVATALLVEDVPLLPLFLALFLVRIVNRSVGLPARITDSVSVAALAVGAGWLFANPWFALMGALAFMLDATLAPGLLRQRVFAVLCAGAAVWLLAATGAPPDRVDPSLRWIGVAIAAAFVVVILLTRRVEAVGDASGEPLSILRVRAGMWVGLFAAAQSLLDGQEAFRESALVWATLAGTACHRPRGR